MAGRPGLSRQANCSGRLPTAGPATRIHLTRLPMPGDNATTTKLLRFGLHDAENTVGWALTDSGAAVAYGAPLAVRTGQLLDFTCPTILSSSRWTWPRTQGVDETWTPSERWVRVW